jgi:hypothetical protein
LDEPSPNRIVCTMTLEEAVHIPAAVRAKMEADYLPHQREARARGVPMLGSGRIFITAEEVITEAPLEYIPAYWKKLWGVDFGIGHPFGAALAAWDVDNDVIHVLHAFRMADALSIVHAAAMKKIGAAVPVAWPRDGTERDRNTGEPLSKAYKKHGLRMLDEHAAWEDGSMSTEAGIQEWDEREKSGRIKFAAHLSDLLEERRFYHRKDGQIIKIKDDILSAVRVLIMSKRYAKAVGLGGTYDRRSGQGQLAAGVDFDVHAG